MTPLLGEGTSGTHQWSQAEDTALAFQRSAPDSRQAGWKNKGDN